MVRFGYDGSRFAGWARQPGLTTVEGTLRAGIVRAGIARAPEAGSPDVASRTDRGVHARGNAVALSSVLSGTALLRALNGISGEIYFTHARAVPEGFRPRQADSRWYRYFESSEEHDLARWEEGARILTGPLDARSFGRGMPAEVPSFRVIDRIDIAREDGIFVIDIRARSFVWGMVRKIVAALRAFDAGELSAARLEAAARGERRLGVPLAEPDGLVLWDVSYPGPWEFAASPASGRQSRSLQEVRRAVTVREAVVAALGGVAPSGRGGKTSAGL